MDSKQCRDCGEEKSLDAYYADRDTKDGKRTRCKPCHIIYTHRNRPPKRTPETPDERFLARIKPSAESDCLLWSGGQRMHFWVDGRTESARRYALMREGVSIPDAMKAVVTCGNVLCVRRSHIALKRKGNGVRHDTKICSDCGIEKSVGEFSPCSTGSLGRFNYCKACFRERKRREAREKPSQNRGMKLAKYGLTWNDFQSMLLRQAGLCAICGEAGGVHGLGVDHDHDTGTVRDLLCGACNAGIAMFKHDAKRMREAAKYVTRWEAVIAGATHEQVPNSTTEDMLENYRRMSDLPSTDCRVDTPA